MKSYWEIPGPAGMPQLPCIAFDKLDGSNLRFEWGKKQGWYKFGSRTVLFNETNEWFGCAIEIFKNTYGDDLIKIFKEDKTFRGVEAVTVFCEFFGKKSFSGVHFPDDPKELVMFDVCLYKKGFMLPRDFVNTFEKLKIPKVIYEGNFNKQFVEDVKNGKYPVYEGVVVKGVNQGKKKNPQHGLWMSKVKTAKWLEDLKIRAKEDAVFRKALEDNQREQQ